MINKQVNDTHSNMVDLQMNIIPSIETQLNAAQAERNAAQTELTEIKGVFKQLNASVENSVQAAISKDSTVTASVIPDNSSSILDTVMNVRAKLSEAIKSVFEQNADIQESLLNHTASIKRIDVNTRSLQDNVTALTTRVLFDDEQIKF